MKVAIVAQPINYFMLTSTLDTRSLFARQVHSGCWRTPASHLTLTSPPDQVEQFSSVQSQALGRGAAPSCSQSRGLAARYLAPPGTDMLATHGPLPLVLRSLNGHVPLLYAAPSWSHKN
jgi:hypothetical protein